MINDRVKIIEDEYKDKTGTIIDVYHGWCFDQYTIRLDEDGSVITLYHDEVEIIEN